MRFFRASGHSKTSVFTAREPLSARNGRSGLPGCHQGARNDRSGPPGNCQGARNGRSGLAREPPGRSKWPSGLPGCRQGARNGCSGMLWTHLNARNGCSMLHCALHPPCSAHLATYMDMHGFTLVYVYICLYVGGAHHLHAAVPRLLPTAHSYLPCHSSSGWLLVITNARAHALGQCVPPISRGQRTGTIGSE